MDGVERSPYLLRMRPPAGSVFGAWYLLWLALPLAGASAVAAQIARDQPSGTLLPYIDGFVVDEAGQPIRGARAELSPESSPNWQTAVADSGGRFAFYDLPVGRYRVTVSASGFGSTSEVVDLVAGPETRRVVLVAGGPTAPAPPAAGKGSYDAGLRELERGRWEHAIRHLEKVIREAPEYAPAYTNLGVAWLQLRSREKARGAFEAALERDSSSAGAHLGLGLILNDEKRYPDAEAHLVEARTLDPSDWHVHYELGRALYGLERVAEAETSLQEAARGRPPFGSLYLLLGNVLVLQQKYGEGLAAMERFLELAPESPLAPQVRQKAALLRAELDRR